MTAAESLAVAAFKDGKSSQAFAAFGPERRGAPVQAFCRISDKFIRLRQWIYNPDIVVVLDPSLMKKVDVFAGIKKGASVIINTDKPVEMKNPDMKVFTVNASSIAMSTIGKPIVNTAMLGAVVKATAIVSLESVKKVILERFKGEMGEKNVQAIERAFNECKAVV